MNALGRGLTLAALVASVALWGCGKKDGDGKCSGGACGSSAGPSAPSGPSTTSAAIDGLIAGVPDNAIAIGFLDLPAPPWAYVTGGAGMGLSDATRAQLDKELHEYLDKYVGVDVSKVQYAVGFFSGPPPGGAILVKTVGGTPKFPGATDVEGAKLWQIDPRNQLDLALKGDTALIGTDPAVRAALETLSGKKKNIAAANKALVDWLHKETAGALVGFAAIAPPTLPLPPEIKGLERVAASGGRAGLHAVVEGDADAIGKLQGLIEAQMNNALAEAERAHTAAIAGDIPPPAGIGAIIGYAWAKDWMAKAKPKREGNRLSMGIDLGGADMQVMTAMSVVGIMAAVAVPAFLDYTKKSKTTEAALMLNRIGKNAKVFFITNAMYPKGDAPLTPAAPCCQGPNGKCPVATWDNPAWKELDFQIDEPTLFQYRYHSDDGVTAYVEAVGDLDCDGTSITYRLDLASQGGNASMTLTEPPPNSD